MKTRPAESQVRPLSKICIAQKGKKKKHQHTITLKLDWDEAVGKKAKPTLQGS